MREKAEKRSLRTWRRGCLRLSNRSLLPAARPAPFPVCGINLPAYEVSGDFYDFFELDDGLLDGRIRELEVHRRRTIAEQALAIAAAVGIVAGSPRPLAPVVLA